MQDGSSAPEEGTTRFAADGTLEVFDGIAWAAYQPLADDGYGSIFKGGVAPEVSTDGGADSGSADGHA